MARGAGTIGLGTVLLGTAAALVLGFLLKAQPTLRDGRLVADCAEGRWEGGIQYTHLCYSDIVPLYGTERLQDHRLPFLEPCTPPPGGNCDEYPVLTMYAMWLASVMGSGYGGFFYANVLLLSVAAGVTSVCLYPMVGRRALYFALAPTLVVYGFMNWDLVAVALATGATLAFLGRRDVAAGVLLGLGASAKLYPALLLVPFVVQRFREREPDRGIHLSWAAGGAWLATNVPFALVAFGGWKTFWTFNARRPLDFDSLWYVGCRAIDPPSGGECLSSQLADVLAVVLVATLGGVVWLLKTRRDRDWARWTFGLPLLILFLLTNKVYSPQYGLWLLPWFALALPGLGALSSLQLFALFEVTDVAVFVARFLWFATYSGLQGPPMWPFELAVVARAAVLVACVVAWVRHPTPAIPALAPPEREHAPLEEVAEGTTA